MIPTSKIITWIRQIANDQTKTDGYDEYEYDTDKRFRLSELRLDSSSIEVYQNGTFVNSAFWSYDSTTNRVTLDDSLSAFSLTSGDNIRIEYSFFEKYSDTEILGYLEGALLYFAEFRYKKLFYLNDDGDIVTSNGTNPCRNEANIIALITAIHIDPNNVNIRTGDFNITAQQDKSKKDQISETIARFSRYVGDITFENLYNEK